MRVAVVLAPALLAGLRDEELGQVVVIDVLRATSTIARALAAGAEGVFPAGDLEQARRAAAEQGALLGGERQGLPPEGFDLGNSPREYDAARCAGRRIVLSTTNGTQAVLAARGARGIRAGSLLNAEATARGLLASGDERVTLLCAGRRGRVSVDDTAAAGCIAGSLALLGAARFDDGARHAIALFDGWRHELWALLAASEAGRHLTELGLADDIGDCALVDAVPIDIALQADGVFRKAG